MSSDNLVSVRFRWPVGDDNHDQVFLCGSFDGWQRHIPMNRVQGGGFETYLSLKPGKYEYKYIVDGGWTYSSKEPKQDDNHGGFNNVLIVPSAENPDGEGSDGEYYDALTRLKKMATPVAARTRSRVKTKDTGAEEASGPLLENNIDSEDHNGVSAEPPIVANSASPSNAKTGDIQCHNFFAVRLQITIPDHSFEINVKEGSTDEAVEAYLHVDGCQADASLQATANEILEEYYAIGTSLQFTGKAEVLFSVVFYSEDCLQTFVKKLKDIEKALAERFEELLCQPKTQRKAQKSSATPQEIPDQHLDLQCKLEVFLAEETPGEEYPTDMTMVTSENLSYFLKKWPCNTAEKIKLHEAHRECMGVVDWIDLGVQLKIPETTLQEIDRDNPKIRGKRVEMLIKWSELETLTWEKLIRALINIGERTAAETIAKQQGVPFPTNLKPCTYQPRGSSSEWTQSGSSGNDIETAIHNLYNQEKKLYHYGSQVLTLTKEKNDLKQLLQMSYKMRDYLINKDVDYSESQKEIALLEKQLKNKEEEISLAKEKFLSLCREMLAKLKGLVNERETSDEDHHDDDVVDETHPKQQMIRAKQLEIQRIKAEVKQLSMTIDGNQDEIETLFNQVECSIATMDDTEYSRKSDRLIMLLKSTIPMKEELRVFIQKKIDAEKELKAMKDVLPARAVKLLKTCHSTMDSLSNQLGKLDAKKSVVELCENYTYEVNVPQLKVVSISGHENCTVCMDCGQICDRNCGVTDSNESIDCCAIDSSSGYCTKCTGLCHHTRHRSTADSICEVTTSTEKRTNVKLKEAHDKAKHDLSALKNKVTEYKQQLEENLKVLRQEFEKHLREAGRSSELDRIAEAVRNAECAVT